MQHLLHLHCTLSETVISMEEKGVHFMCAIKLAAIAGRETL